MYSLAPMILQQTDSTVLLPCDTHTHTHTLLPVSRSTYVHCSTNTIKPQHLWTVNVQDFNICPSSILIPGIQRSWPVPNNMDAASHHPTLLLLHRSLSAQYTPILQHVGLLLSCVMEWDTSAIIWCVFVAKTNVYFIKNKFQCFLCFLRLFYSFATCSYVLGTKQPTLPTNSDVPDSFIVPH